MYRIAIIHDVERQSSRGPIRWAYATRSNCLQKYAPSDFEVCRLSDADTHGGGWRRIVGRGVDVIFALDYALAPSYVRHARQAGFEGVIVGSFNKDHRSREREWLHVLDCGLDWLIVNNVSRWRRGGVQPRTCCISNGLDLDHWRATTPFDQRPERAIWCGGTGPAKKKGYAEVLVPLKSILERDGIECDFRPVSDITPEQVKTPDEQLAWYNSARYVVCASETEGTPGYLLESMACGCIPITTNVGNVPEIMKGELHPLVVKKRTLEEFARRIGWLRGESSWSDWAAREMRLRWGYGPPANRAEYFFHLFRRLIDDGPDSIEPFCHWDVKPEDI